MRSIGKTSKSSQICVKPHLGNGTVKPASAKKEWRRRKQRRPRTFLPSLFFLITFVGGRIGDIAVFGQESNSTTRRLAMMNLAIRSIEGDLGPVYADTFRRDLHIDLQADDVLANPPFNDSDWNPTTPAPIASRLSIESPQRKTQRHFVRMRRIESPLPMPLSL